MKQVIVNFNLRRTKAEKTLSMRVQPLMASRRKWLLVLDAVQKRGIIVNRCRQI